MTELVQHMLRLLSSFLRPGIHGRTNGLVFRNEAALITLSSRLSLVGVRGSQQCGNPSKGASMWTLEGSGVAPRRVTLGFLFPALCVLISSAAVAAVNSWSPIGPPGGPIERVAIAATDPQIAWVATHGEIFRTTDGGVSWALRCPQLRYSGDPFLTALIADPSNPAGAYVATQHQVVKTDDGGSTWDDITRGLTGTWGQPVGALSFAVDPGPPSFLYAGTPGGGVFRSTDGGQTWHAVNNGLPAEAFVGLVTMQSPSSSVLIARIGNTLYGTTDHGDTWSVVAASLPTSVYCVAPDPSRGDTFYVGNYDGLYRTSDGGATWLSLPGAGSVSTIALDPVHPGTIFCGYVNDPGVKKTTDGGLTWTTEAGPWGVLAFGIAATDPETVYAGTQWTVMKTADGGAHWRGAGGGIAGLDVLAVAVDPSHPSTLFAASSGSAGSYGFDTIYKTTDSGATWADMSPPADGAEVLALAIDPLHTDTIWAGSSAYADLFKSTDGGKTWAPSFPTNVIIDAIAIDPTRTDTVYAAGSGGHGGGILRTTDGGHTWTTLYGLKFGASVESLAMAPGSPTTLFAGLGGDSIGVLKTVDAGATWDKLPATSGWWVSSLAVDPATADSVYAGTGQGLFKSTDGGTSWAAATLPNSYQSNVSSVLIDPTSPAIVYAATDAGVFRTVDAGANWVTVNAGLSELGVGNITLDPTGSSTLYAAVVGGSLWSITFVPPTITSAAQLPAAVAGRAYTTTLSATGGSQPLTWSISAGSLPSGLVLDGHSGVVSGAPSIGGVATFTVRVTDAALEYAERECQIDVAVEHGVRRHLRRAP